MFGQDSTKVKVAVIEEKVRVHEAVVERVDAAIQALRETNQNICRMLAVHEEKIEQKEKSEGDLIYRVEKVEGRVDGLYQFRWQFAGAVAIIGILIAIFNAFGPMMVDKGLTPAKILDKIEHSK